MNEQTKFNELQQKAIAISNEVKKVIIGKNDIIDRLLISFLARGHVLLDDIPGVGKTTMALAFSRAMNLNHQRLQFTPDVLPTDVTGFSVYNKDTDTFTYKPGAAICNLFLADEINRTSSKTQSALLEVMEEGKVTIDGITRELPKPYIVIATQNPIGSIGTQMLPESQLDRFMVKISMGYPDVESEYAILKGKQNRNPLEAVNEVASAEDIVEMQQIAEQVYVSDDIYHYIAKLAETTRNHEMLELGMSPRGSIATARLARAYAFIKGRNYVVPDDVAAVFLDASSHRVILSPKARVNGTTVENVIDDILKTVEIPAIEEQ
ncbi:MAG: MoxR family ATPase [Clostridia bacterium]|nr:MoxR family ATPase [Clostridia bacterium]MBQ7108086.1 MoxR family ATPase [Clostridia bacterium]